MHKVTLTMMFVTILFSMGTYQVVVAADMPHVFSLNPKALVHVKDSITANNHEFDAALTTLYKKAKSALKANRFSVVDKPMTPPSGDKHDFLSLARYWWPNPDTPDGLPYIRHDGEVNPDRNKIPDESGLAKMISAVNILSLAYYLKGDETFAAKATDLLQIWFIDEATRMNPNMKYSQIILGHSDQSSGGGIISGRNLSRIVDSVGLLAGSKAWTADDQHAMEQWFTQYLSWLTTTPEGFAESKATNNHGSWYDVQVASIALFVGQTEFARSTLTNVGLQRITNQIDPDGRQPLELGRAKSWDYSIFNLQAFFQLATMGDNVDVDLWTFQTEDKSSIRNALDYLLSFALGDQEWPYDAISAKNKTDLSILLQQAAAKYHDDKYQTAALNLGGSQTGGQIETLFYLAESSSSD